ncbi:unnamed protein product [Effrenium voratum]|nr:unnamed protein product [Effrenium voratum]
MDLLKFVDAETGEPMGTINWFAVHPVSMTSDYDLISGDNKGYAEYIFEKEINGPSHLQPAGRGPFVASFAQGAAGDVSPNILGDFCTDTGLSCENQYSVCWQNGQPKNELCRSRGPGRDSFESMKIIGERQYSAAKAIFDQATQPLGDGLGYAARFVDLSKYYIEKNGTWAQTCSPCLGTTFAAGTADGPSAVNEFGQNMTPSNGFLQFIAHMISLPTAEEKACQAPKNILLHPGGMNVPYPFFPSVLGFQLMRVGNLILVAVPGEFTTMAGKRTREAVKAVFVDAGVVNDTAMVVMNNVASGYAGYVTTIEEYQHQRYEGGFTAYGPHTHEAMTDILVKMAEDMVANKNTFPGMKPSLPSKDQLMEGQTDVLVDDPPIGGSFGDIKQDVAGGAHSAGETLRCILWGAHPRNNLKRGSSFFTVYRWQPINASDGNANAGKWLLYADDNDWDTRFGWKREGISASLVTLDWTIPAEVEPGWYVFHYSGDAKKWGGAITPISASCSIFEVVSSGGSAKMAAKSAPEAAVLALAELKAAQTKPQEPLEPAKPPSPRRLRGSEELHQ